MSEAQTQENHPTKRRRVRRAYLVYVFAGPAIVGLLGGFLIALAVFSAQPIPVRVAELPVGALMLIVAVFMPRMSGPLEFSLFRSSLKANLDAMLPEALVLAREAAVEVQPQDDLEKERKADEAVRRVLLRLTWQQLKHEVAHSARLMDEAAKQLQAKPAGEGGDRKAGSEDGELH
jgi:hypothetical protein